MSNQTKQNTVKAQMNNENFTADAIDEYEASQKGNIMAIDRMQRVVDRLKLILDSPKRRKILLLRLLVYIGQFILIAWIASLIPNPWGAIAVSCIVAYVTTVLINILMKKLEVKENLGEMKNETFRDLTQSVISSFPFMPSFIQDNIVSFTARGVVAKRMKELHMLRNYKNCMEKFIQARKSFRVHNFEDTQKLIKQVIRIAKHNKFDDLLSEAQIFAHSINAHNTLLTAKDSAQLAA